MAGRAGHRPPHLRGERPALDRGGGRRGAGHADLERPRGRRSRPQRAVLAVAGGRPSVRPRRLRHEGWTGRDAGRAGRPVTGARADPGRQGEAADRARRGVGGGLESAQVVRVPGGRGAPGRVRGLRRADQPRDRRPGEGRPGRAGRGGGPGRARLHPLAGRQRGAEGVRALPQDPGAAVRVRQLGAVRAPVHQHRPHPRRRGGQHRARPLPDGRRHPLPAQPGAGRGAAAAAVARRRGDADLRDASGHARSGRAARAGAARGRGRAGGRRRPLRSVATAPPTRCSSWSEASPRSSSGRPAEDTTGRRSTSRSSRCGATAGSSWNSRGDSHRLPIGGREPAPSRRIGRLYCWLARPRLRALVCQGALCRPKHRHSPLHPAPVRTAARPGGPRSTSTTPGR